MYIVLNDYIYIYIIIVIGQRNMLMKYSYKNRYIINVRDEKEANLQ